MHRPQTKLSGRNLSADDRKALDVLLDHGPNARDAELTRHTPAVPPRRLSAVSKVLDLLAELPEIDPPKDLVARTMELIDRDIAAQVGKRAAASAASIRPQVH
jgi:hypothetical protein